MPRQAWINWAVVNGIFALLLFWTGLYQDSWMIMFMNVTCTIMLLGAALIVSADYLLGNKFIEQLTKENGLGARRTRLYLTADRAYDLAFSLGLFVSGLYYGFVAYVASTLLLIYHTERVYAFVHTSESTGVTK